jgi:hypothetical protein
MPKSLLNRPVLAPHLHYPYAVFWEMSDVRREAMHSFARIAHADFLAYCWLMQIPAGPEAADLWRHLAVLDKALAKYAAEKQKSSAKKPA